MKLKSLLTSFLFIVFIHPSKTFGQANTQDSLALVDLYNSTNGPGWIKNTNWLTSAPLSSWDGVVTGNGGHVTSLLLTGNRLIGPLPSSFGNLSQLGTLYLNGNGLNGSIPSSIGNLTSISIMNFSMNQLSGPIPATLNNLVNAFGLYFGHNLLSGNLPDISAITPSAAIDLSYNQFTFTSFYGHSVVPIVIMTPQADLPLITNGNVLSIAAGGSVSANTYAWYKGDTLIATIHGDSTFTISSPGNYSVSVTTLLPPDQISMTLNSISVVNVQDSLALVDLYNSTAGNKWSRNINWLTSAPLDTWSGVSVQYGRVTSLQENYNNLTGTIPAPIGDLTNLTTLEGDNNQLNGSLPSTIGNLSQLNYMSLMNNQLSGSIPSTLGSLSALTQLSLGYNQFTGNIPPAIANMTSLSVLELDDNQLTDTIPYAIDRLSNLTNLDLSDNQLTGTIPDSLTNCIQLFRLRLFNNQLTGKIPDSIGKLLKLADLELYSNQLSGPIPFSLSQVPYMAFLYISNNHFTFAGIENLPPVQAISVYYPQAIIPLNQISNVLSVAAGDIANDTFRLYKDGSLIATQIGDSAFTITSLGKYNIVTTNSNAPLLTLYSDTLGTNLILPDSTLSTTQSISGTTPIDITNGIFNIVDLTPAAGSNGLIGNVTTIETIDSAISTFNNVPYVQRHYDITPDVNATNAQATITLYFAQSDFDTYNSYTTAHNLGIPLLPTNGIDNGNVQIMQFHGQFTGTSNPANYSQGSEFITPTVAWDAVDKWWTVTFPVTGFSGFFLNSGSQPLPLTLLQFTGSLAGMAVNLQWQTTDEVNVRQFIVQRASDGVTFNPIGTVAAKDLQNQNSYTFTDANPLTGNNFYRLKMKNSDGSYSYSPVILVTTSAATAFAYSAYPNPATNETGIIFNSSGNVNYTIEVTDLSGRRLSQVTGITVKGLNNVNIDVRGYAAGIYTITIFDEENGQRSLKLSKL